MASLCTYFVLRNYTAKNYNLQAHAIFTELNPGRVAGVKRSKISPCRSPKRLATSIATPVEAANEAAAGGGRSRTPSESESVSPDSTRVDI
jgi:hypothetical protein